MNNNYDFWFWLSAMANFAQLHSYELLLTDANNNDLMHYLTHHERSLLNEIIDQNKTIINQNQTIIDLLKGREDDA